MFPPARGLLFDHLIAVGHFRFARLLEGRENLFVGLSAGLLAGLFATDTAEARCVILPRRVARRVLFLPRRVPRGVPRQALRSATSVNPAVLLGVRRDDEEMIETQTQRVGRCGGSALLNTLRLICTYCF